MITSPGIYAGVLQEIKKEGHCWPSFWEDRGILKSLTVAKLNLLVLRDSPKRCFFWLECGSDFKDRNQRNPGYQKKRYGLTHRGIQYRAQAGYDQRRKADQDKAE